MSNNLPFDNTPENRSELYFYQTADGLGRIQLRLHADTARFTQKLIADLCQTAVNNTVNEHVQAIYEDGEISPEATTRKFRIVKTEREREVSRLVDYYRHKEGAKQGVDYFDELLQRSHLIRSAFVSILLLTHPLLRSWNRSSTLSMTSIIGGFFLFARCNYHRLACDIAQPMSISTATN